MMTKKEFLFWLLVVAILGAVLTAGINNAAAAEEAAPNLSPEFKISGMPSFALKLSEGWGISLAGGEAAPGGVSTRLDFAVSWKLAPWFGLGTGVGISVPEAEFKPSLRLTPGMTFYLPEKFSIGTGVLYNYTYGYGGKPAAHLVGPSIGLGYALTDHVGIGFTVGAGKTLYGGDWGLNLSPGIAYKF